MTVKQLNNEINQLETLRLDEQRMRTQIEAELQQSSAEKESYLEEFRKLKGEYETVITRLEGSAMAYQKSNWALEQENKDLNDQLQGLQ